MKYKLTYFAARGRGEVVRMILSEAGEKFEDERIDFDRWNDETRDATQTGFLPSFQEDDFKFSGSLVIARYLARKYGLLGETAQEAARIEMIMDMLYDYESVWSDVNFAEDEHTKADAEEKAKSYDRLLDVLESFLTANGGKYFVGNKLSAADIMALSNLESYRSHLTDRHSNLNKLLDAVSNRPRIAAWMTRRPETDF